MFHPRIKQTESMSIIWMPTKIFSNETQTFNTVTAKENSCAPYPSQFSPVKIPLAYFPKTNFVFVICYMFRALIRCTYFFKDEQMHLGVCMTVITQ